MISQNLEKILLQVQKPAQYIGGELNSIVKDKEAAEGKIDCRLAFCFPDKYEVGMSHLGMKILYSLYNNRKDLWCERVFAPDADMEALMRENSIPIYGLESLEPVKNFDFILFTLQYEMSYTAILNMLDLAGLPVRAKERKGLFPIVAAGGPCACNPEPIAEFVDMFLLGEGEELNLEITDLYIKAKKEGWSKEKYLLAASKIQGVYVPSLYQIKYNPDGTIEKIFFSIKEEEIREEIKIKKRIIKDLDKVFYPDKFIVPYIEIVHDRAMLEVQRGCVRGCRFCQAGFIYRPLRDKHAGTLNENAHGLCDSTGYDEISLTSLSTSDYKELSPLLDKMLPWTSEQKVGMSLPSLRVDNFSKDLMEKVSKLRKSGLTFAPEAGTQRLRDVINKNVSEEELMNTCRTAFEGGYTAVKLYFMMGLPTETLEDIEGIAILAQKVVDLFYSLPTKPKGKGVTVSVSCACFVPKPFTPFEFEGQDTMEALKIKQKHLLASVKSKKISVSYHSADVSFIEAVLAKGDRRLCDVVELVWKKGARLDGWYEYFKAERWYEAFKECGIDPAFYANRHREYDEIMPWDHLDYYVTKSFLIKENKLAHSSQTTPNCCQKCSNCGCTAAANCDDENKSRGTNVCMFAHEEPAKISETRGEAASGGCTAAENCDEENKSRGTNVCTFVHEEPAKISETRGETASVGCTAPAAVRVFYKKVGRARYISHLDMNRCMTRAVKRSGVPVWYTQGFNPHMYLTFPLPISLGYESECECVDLKLNEFMNFDEIMSKINACLPPDIQIFKACEPKMNQKEIAWADYEIDLICDEGKEDELATSFTEYLSADEIKVMKRSKKTPHEIDIKPYTSLLALSPDYACVKTKMRFATGIELNINPSLLLDNYKAFPEIKATRIKRISVLNDNLQIFE